MRCAGHRAGTRRAQPAGRGHDGRRTPRRRGRSSMGRPAERSATPARRGRAGRLAAGSGRIAGGWPGSRCPGSRTAWSRTGQRRGTAGPGQRVRAIGRTDLGRPDARAIRLGAAATGADHVRHAGRIRTTGPARAARATSPRISSPRISSDRLARPRLARVAEPAGPPRSHARRPRPAPRAIPARGAQRPTVSAAIARGRRAAAEPQAEPAGRPERRSRLGAAA
jgi:hypothetical protein